MSTVYLNGQWLRLEDAKVSVEDRGFMFADGVYEVVRYCNGHPVAMDHHVRRLGQSLRAIRIGFDDGVPDMARISDEWIERNQCPDAAVYWQITRGVAPRRHAFPTTPTPPTVLAMGYPLPAFDPAGAPRTIRAITRPDIRWGRCSIKSISLLPGVLDAQAAVDADRDLAILTHDGVVTEGSSTSILIVEGERLVTHPINDKILDSVTRRIVIDCATEAGIEIEQVAPSIDRLKSADEVIAVGTTTEVSAVIQIDSQTIGSGHAGPVTSRLHQLFVQYVCDACRIARG